jgi:hypothetical protein
MPTVTEGIRRFLTAQRDHLPGADLIDRVNTHHKPIPHLTLEEINRFWSKVDQSNGPDACWEWQGATNGKKGYGQLTLRRRQFYAHRLAYALAYDDPRELLVCHHCDNPLCCNPSRHFLGTIKDDVADMLKKGRAGGGAKNPPKGTEHSRAKLTEADVRQIRLTPGISSNAWARHFNVSPGTISCIVHRKTWKHIAG